MIRCEDRELLDADEVPEQVVGAVYRELRLIHFWLGNTHTLLRLLRQGRQVRRVLDIGCGYGAMLETIRRKLDVEVVGVDLRTAPHDAPVPILTGNAVTDPLPEADVAICVVMAHHLTEVELAALIGNVARSCRRLILLDLVRHPMPLWLFRIFVAPLVNRVNALDGKTSIRRAYTTAEMRRIVDGALRESAQAVKQVRYTLGPLWIRQVVDISWEGC